MNLHLLTKDKKLFFHLFQIRISLLTFFLMKLKKFFNEKASIVLIAYEGQVFKISC